VIGFEHSERYPSAAGDRARYLLNPVIVPLSERHGEGWEGLTIRARNCAAAVVAIADPSGRCRPGRVNIEREEGFHARVGQHD